MSLAPTWRLAWRHAWRRPLQSLFLIVASSLAIGFVAGFVMYRADFCTTASFRDLFLFRDFFLMRQMILLVVVSMALFEFGRLTGLIAQQPFPLLAAPTLANLVGGFVFGIGMVLAGGCVVGSLYKMGAGSLASALAFAGMLAGSAAYDDRPEVDAVAVARARAAGAIVLAKVTTHEFALGVTSPQSRNPHDPTRIPGGSSGGSAVAVSTGAAGVPVTVICDSAAGWVMRTQKIDLVIVGAGTIGGGASVFAREHGAERVGHREEGHLAGQAQAPADGDEDVRRGHGSVHQRGLPDAGLAAHAHDLAVAAACGGQAVAEERQLVPAPHEGGEPAAAPRPLEARQVVGHVVHGARGDGRRAVAARAAPGDQRHAALQPGNRRAVRRCRPRRAAAADGRARARPRAAAISNSPAHHADRVWICARAGEHCTLRKAETGRSGIA